MINNANNKLLDKEKMRQIADRLKIIAIKTGRKISAFFSVVFSKSKSFYSKQKDKSSKKIRRTGRERVYRLKGYTTVAKINRKRHAERQQLFLRKSLFIIIAIMIVIILFVIYNPFKDMTEVKKILGIDSVDDITQTAFFNETTESERIIITETSETDIEDNQE